jgi:uncharacterized protein (UPF0371 family)
MRRITASHPDYAEINLHMTYLNIIKNKHMHEYKDTSINYTEDMHKFEILTLVARIESEIDHWLDGGLFRDYLNATF